MVTGSHQACVRTRTAALQACTALAVLVSAAACGSSGPAASPRTSAATVADQTCQQVSAVLTDGPDPGADPVGYAEAQILPLRQIRTSDPTLSQAIAILADAYSGYSSANGKGTTVTATLTSAINRINSLCPGAGATQ